MPQHGPFRTLFKSAVACIGDYRCQACDPGRGPEECNTVPGIALVRRGSFVKHLGSRRVVVDAGSAVFFNAWESYRVSHPAGCGDRCSVFHLSDSVLREVLSATDPAAADREFRVFSRTHDAVGPAAYLAHRILLRAIDEGACEPLAADEAALEIAAAVLAGRRSESSTPRSDQRADTQRAHRDLAADARVALNRRLGERISLDDLAREVHSSPYHLARVFRAQTGSTIRRHRDRLRVRASLDAIAGGETDLTRLALSLGYCDHSHFTNAFRREFGTTPSSVRRAATPADLRRMSKFLQA